VANAKSRPFKKFYCDRNETFLLEPIAFKIWMYHYARESADRKSWPAVDTVMKACGITRIQTFYKWRAYLRTNGWLQKVGEVQSKGKSGLPIPIFKVTRGTITIKCEKRTKRLSAKNAPNPDPLSAKNAPSPSALNAPSPSALNAPRSRTTEVAPFEEDSKNVKPEVEGSERWVSSLKRSVNSDPKPDSPAVARAKALLHRQAAPNE
jgi:hypothetical protein